MEVAPPAPEDVEVTYPAPEDVEVAPPGEEIFVEPGCKMNFHKWHMIMKRKIKEDGVGDLKGMAYHSFLAWMKDGRKKGSTLEGPFLSLIHI